MNIENKVSNTEDNRGANPIVRFQLNVTNEIPESNSSVGLPF